MTAYPRTLSSFQAGVTGPTPIRLLANVVDAAGTLTEVTEWRVALEAARTYAFEIFGLCDATVAGQGCQWACEGPADATLRGGLLYAASGALSQNVGAGVMTGAILCAPVNSIGAGGQTPLWGRVTVTTLTAGNFKVWIKGETGANTMTLLAGSALWWQRIG